MPADQSLRERIDDQRERVVDAMEHRDNAKRRVDAARERKEKAQKLGHSNVAREWDEAYERRLEILKEARKDLDEKRDRLIELKDERDDRRRKQREKFSTAPGAPAWGGSELIIQREVIPAVKSVRPNVTVTSGKRTETFGNPGSDHHVSQTRASARDFALTNDGTARNAVSRRLAGRDSADYEAVFFEYEGHEYRLQGIAQTHGTGPHLHEGIELVG